MLCDRVKLNLRFKDVENFKAISDFLIINYKNICCHILMNYFRTKIYFIENLIYY